MSVELIKKGKVFSSRLRARKVLKKNKGKYCLDGAMQVMDYEDGFIIKGGAQSGWH